MGRNRAAARLCEAHPPATARLCEAHPPATARLCETHPPAAVARVRISDVAGRGFDANATYSIATISFLSNGGDTYYAFKQASEAERPTTFGFDYEAFTSYLVTACDHKVPDQYAEPQGRITITGLS